MEPFDPSPDACGAFRDLFATDGIIPLAGPSHIHWYPDGFHMADNLMGGAKIYYEIDPSGNIYDINIG
jgi:hypothetical protein